MDYRAAWSTAFAASITLFLATAQAQVMPATTQTLDFNGITVVNSSADLDEVDKLKRISSSYALRILFSGKGGDYYVADKLVVKQRGVALADIAGAGPMLLLAVPNGSYELEAVFGDRTLRRVVNVGRGGSTVHWLVPASID